MDRLRLFQDGVDLLTGHAGEPLQKLGDRSATLEILEERAYRYVVSSTTAPLAAVTDA